MTERPIYRSLVNRLAVEVPLFAKAIVDDALAQHHLSPGSVTPFQLKRLIDTEIVPRLTRILRSARSPHVSTLGGGTVQIDEHDDVVHISPSARRLLQLAPTLAGPRLLRRLEELGAVRHGEQLVADGRHLESWRIELERTYLQCSAALIRRSGAKGGAAAGVLVTIYDVTLEKELEDAMVAMHEALRDGNRELKETMGALQAMAEKAEAASDAKSRFLATMSHEIRTPLNAVVGMTSLLLDTPMSEQQREYARTAVQGARVLLSLIDDIMDLSRLESGGLEVERMPFAVRVPVGEAAGLVRARMSKGDVAFAWNVDEGVPERVVGDPARLRQVLLNLLDNACKFTRAGRVELFVRCAPAQGSNPVLSFRVEDTGIGISEDRIEHVFDAFTQADVSTTREFGGSGLGLTICRHLVERMGGAIGVESILGVGTAFTLTIPFLAIDQGELTAGDEVREDEEPRETLPSDREGRILVVEDNRVNRLVITRILERLGYDVCVVENGLEAVRALREPFDAVLMDCQMPVMDGFEATHAIRHGDEDVRDRRVPIIALTASTLEEERERCRAAGMNAFISKPVMPLELEKVLRVWVGASNSEGARGQGRGVDG